ncbi:MAG: TIGR00725 family protein [Bacteroidota bacterium]
MGKVVIGIIGPGDDMCTKEIYRFGQELGEKLASKGYILVNGGKSGIMEAVFKGAKNSTNFQFGQTIGIIPEESSIYANQYADIVIPTGVGTARNKILINTADLIIAIAGGAGTLSEISFAWQMQKPIIAFTGFSGWSSDLAGKALDKRRKEPIYKASSILEILNLTDRLTN